MIAGSIAGADALNDGFEFVDAGRTFTCAAAPLRASSPEGWWWFSVGGDIRGQRYAPFRASSDDTRAGVQARVLAYYEDLLVRRAAPAVGHHWSRRRPSVAAADGVPAGDTLAGPALAAPADTPVA
jgi:hypothetical protein